jgi:hypothetical protein
LCRGETVDYDSLEFEKTVHGSTSGGIYLSESISQKGKMATGVIEGETRRGFGRLERDISEGRIEIYVPIVSIAMCG